jgi:hypothetical protein
MVMLRFEYRRKTINNSLQTYIWTPSTVIFTFKAIPTIRNPPTLKEMLPIAVIGAPPIPVKKTLARPRMPMCSYQAGLERASYDTPRIKEFGYQSLSKEPNNDTKIC